MPGAFEMPLVAQKVARSGKADAIVCVGAVIRSAAYFDFVCNEATKGIAHVSMETGVPIGFGLLTTDTLEQSIERASGKGRQQGRRSRGRGPGNPARAAADLEGREPT
ncbi:hypothetical protein MASR2M17_23530 [Aminivibrio sp.]